MILSLKWRDPQNPPNSHRKESPQMKVCWGTVGRLFLIRSAPTKRRVSIYTLQNEAYDQPGHACDLQKIFCDSMQRGLSDTVTH